MPITGVSIESPCGPLRTTGYVASEELWIVDVDGFGVDDTGPYVSPGLGDNVTHLAIDAAGAPYLISEV